MMEMLLEKVKVVWLEADTELQEMERMRIPNIHPLRRDIVGFFDRVVGARMERRSGNRI